MHRDDGKWRMVGAPSALANRDLSFTDRRMDTHFEFATTFDDMIKMRNVIITVMSPEQDQPDPVWGVLTRDFKGGVSRGPQRFRTPALAEGIAMWIRSRLGGGGYASFERPPQGRARAPRHYRRDLRPGAPARGQGG
jgi:hypothetical protein